VFGSSTLDVVIGLSYLFVMLSLVATAVREAVEALLKTRAIQLEQGIRMLLDETVTVAKPVVADAVKQTKAEVLATATDTAKDGMTDTLFRHPLLYSLFQGDYGAGKNALTSSFMSANVRPQFMSKLPAYIPSRSFALALIDTVARGPVGGFPANADLPVDFNRVRAAVAGLDDNLHLKRALLIAIDQAKGDLDRLHVAVASWFDSSMDRVSGWYKRETQWILLAIGLVVAIAGNVDSIRVAQALSADTVRRDAIVAEAGTLYEKARATDSTTAINALGTNAQTLNEQARSLGYPIGWSQPDGTARPFLWTTPLGWLITAMAVSLGAPFWFDVLAKVMNIRTALRPADSTKAAAAAADPPAAAPPPDPEAATASLAVPVADGFTPNRWVNGAADEGVL
jgi:hypothetical protein